MDTSSNPPLDPSQWFTEWNRVSPIVQALQQQLDTQAKSPAGILRVNQLDAVYLDAEILEMLKVQFLKIFSLFQSDVIGNYKAELDALLDFLVFRFTLWSNRPTPGNKLQNLHYQDEAQVDRLETLVVSPKAAMTTSQKILYMLLQIGGKWLWARANRYTSQAGWAEQDENDWRKRAWRWLGRCEVAYNAAWLINFVVFLVQGKYRSIADRLLGLRLVYLYPLMGRNISFEFMNRQLVWHGFTELVLFLMPLINFERIRSIISRVIRGGRGPGSPGDSIPAFACPVCKSSPIVTPFISTSCSHVFCYYCLKSSCMADAHFGCPRCGVVVAGMRRFSPQTPNTTNTTAG